MAAKRLVTLKRWERKQHLRLAATLSGSAPPLTDVPSCLPQGNKACWPFFTHTQTHACKIVIPLSQIPQTTQDNHSLVRQHTHTHTHTQKWVCQWSALFELTIVPCSLVTMGKPNPYSAVVDGHWWNKRPRQGEKCKWWWILYIKHTQTHTQTHTHTHTHGDGVWSKWAGCSSPIHSCAASLWLSATQQCLVLI